MATSKDSLEVVQFMSLFSRLKDWADDDPAILRSLADNDKAVAELCAQVGSAVDNLRSSERRRRELFAAPVDPKFLAAFRDFEDRFERVVDEIFLALVFPELGELEPEHGTKADFHWTMADEIAAEEADAIENAIHFAKEQADQNWRDLPGNIRSGIDSGAEAWERLKDAAGFQLRSVFRRRQLVPFVLVPRHIAARSGDPITSSMLQNLQQAHDAFVFGAPFASLALMRSIMEVVLRENYGAEGADLCARINNASRRLPKEASPAALHRLRLRANAILHLDQDVPASASETEPEQLEKEIVSLLLVLRALIERAPH